VWTRSTGIARSTVSGCTIIKAVRHSHHPLCEEDPEESVSPAELWALDRSGQCGELLPEREIFERDSPVSLDSSPIDRRSTTSAVSIRDLVVQSNHEIKRTDRRSYNGGPQVKRHALL
jgi:hypothetical protein